MGITAVSSDVRTFLIADIRGYTRFTLDQGDEAAARLAAKFAQLTRQVVAARGGEVIELRGDEALAVFASPRQALWSAVDLQEAFLAESLADPTLPLRVGIGLDAGEAIRVEGGYRGAALNLAARLCSVAGPGEVLCSEGVVHLARKVEGLEYRPRGAQQVKGFASPVTSIQVVRADATLQTERLSEEEAPAQEQHLSTGGFLGSLPSGVLVARQRELEQIRQQWRAVLEGTGRTVLLAGEPGAGKTRLGQEITLELQQSGFLIAAGRCYEPEQSVAYYPFLDALATVYALAPRRVREEASHRWPYLGALLPDQIGVPEVFGGQEDQHRVFRAVTSFLEAASAARPVALLLDDLHWADSATLRLLTHLARHSRDVPVFILGTYRDVDVGRKHPLEGVLRDLNREGLIERIEVRRLTQEGTGALVAAIIGDAEVSDEFAELVYRRTEGNPYFVQQVMRVLVERGDVYRQDGKWARRDIDQIEVPESVRSVVGNRLSRLSEETQDVLHQASVLGQTFRFDDLLAMGTHGEQALEDALEESGEAALIHSGDGEVYSFDHALTQQSLYNELSPRRRRRLHLAAGKAIEELPEHGRQQRVAELAWHFLQGDDPDKALHYSKEAGDRAEAVFAHADAEAQYRIALELARESQDKRQEAEVLERLGKALRHSGQYIQARELLERAAQLYRELDDREGELGAVAQIGWLHANQGTSEEGINRILPVVQDLEEEGVETLSPACTASLYVTLAWLYYSGGKWQELLRVADEAVRLAESAGDDRLLAEAEQERGRALSLAGRMEEAEKAAAHAAKLAQRVGDLATLRSSLNNLAYLQRREGQLQQAADTYRQALEVAERVGDPSIIAFARFVLGRVCVERGEWAAARALFEQAQSAAQSADSSWYSSYALAGLGCLYLLEGEREEGLRFLTEAIETVERNADVQGLIMHTFVAHQEVLDGKPNEAVTRLERVRQKTKEAGREIFHWQLPWALLAAGEVERAAGLLEHFDERMLYEARIELPHVLRVSAMIARCQGRWEDAERDLADALSMTREMGMPYNEALVLQEYGRLHAARGEQDEARARLEEALAIFERLAARPDVEQTEQLIAATA